jgi:hypothetical protein
MNKIVVPCDVLSSRLSTRAKTTLRTISTVVKQNWIQTRHEQAESFATAVIPDGRDGRSPEPFCVHPRDVTYTPVLPLQVNTTLRKPSGIRSTLVFLPGAQAVGLFLQLNSLSSCFIPLHPLVTNANPTMNPITKRRLVDKWVNKLFISHNRSSDDGRTTMYRSVYCVNDTPTCYVFP